MNHNKPKEISSDGAFNRQKNRFTTPFGNDDGELPVEPDRYRLLWSAACPWAHRSVIVRKVLGLEDVISLGTVSPMRPRIPRVDWEFSLDEQGKDPVLGITYLSEIYEKTDPDYSGRPTVPVVVDVKKQIVVNNDYFNLTNYLETEWAPYHRENAPDLYPEHLRKEIDALNEVIYHDVNNGVYKCGFAQSQEAYEDAYNSLFTRLDELDKRLSTARYLFGDFITDSDVRLYTTLVRFDAVYFSAFNTNLKLIREYENLWGYVRDLYQTPGFGDTTDFDAIKKHYFLSITISPDKVEPIVLPKGPDLSIWNTPHGREQLSEKDGNQQIAIRDARPSEIELIRNQRVDAYSAYCSVLSSDHWEALKRALSSDADLNEDVDVIVAVKEGTVVGSVALFPAHLDAYEGKTGINSYPEIRMLAVDPKSRGEGLATALVNECIKRAKSRGFTSIGLHTGEFMSNAIQLYEKLGFQRFPEQDFQPANDGINVRAYVLKI